jgi:alpha-L-fucosidase 2
LQASFVFFLLLFQTYYLLLNANRLGLSSTLTDFVASIQTELALNTPVAWRNDSSAAPTGASSLQALETCYWNYGPDCLTSPPSVTGNLLWVLQLVHLHAEYSQNTTIATEVLWPTLERALNFYLHFLVLNGTTFEVPVTFSPEWPGGPGPNANFDIALLRWGLELADRVSAQGATGQTSHDSSEAFLSFSCLLSL